MHNEITKIPFKTGVKRESQYTFWTKNNKFIFHDLDHVSSKWEGICWGLGRKL